MKFIALKTDDGRITGNISFYCIALDVSRWGFYKYLQNRDNPWKYEDLANEMREIQNEDLVLSIIVDTISQKIYKPASIYYSTYSLR